MQYAEALLAAMYHASMTKRHGVHCRLCFMQTLAVEIDHLE
jgi:hypothetical protein